MLKRTPRDVAYFINLYRFLSDSCQFSQAYISIITLLKNVSTNTERYFEKLYILTPLLISRIQDLTICYTITILLFAKSTEYEMLNNIKEQRNVIHSPARNIHLLETYIPVAISKNAKRY